MEERKRRPWPRATILLLSHGTIGAAAFYAGGFVGYIRGFERGSIIADVVEGALAVRRIESLDRGSTDHVKALSEMDVDSALTSYARHLEGDGGAAFAPTWLSADFLKGPMKVVVAYRQRRSSLAENDLVRKAVASGLRRAAAQLELPAANE